MRLLVNRVTQALDHHVSHLTRSPFRFARDLDATFIKHRRLNSSIAKQIARCPSNQRAIHLNSHVITQCRTFTSSAHLAKEEWPKVSVTEPATGQPSSAEPRVAQIDSAKSEITSQKEDGMTIDSSITQPITAKPVIEEPTVKHAADENLPSRRAALQSQLIQWANKKMEEIIPKLVLASQRINTFTGTDYSAIEELRREIKQQEVLVEARLKAVSAAKENLDEAHAQRATSQKEVVGLLERKHSWSAADLERYMNLIRSEHQNDHAVQEAKDAVTTAEKSLEEGRARLEERERRQYHEEQIWSDTIRRNSTWITFGLMGVNILLLLANLAIFEPYRRRRIVREIKAAMDEKSITPATALVAASSPTITETSEKELDAVIPPAGTSTEALKTSLSSEVPKPVAEVIEAEVATKAVESDSLADAPVVEPSAEASNAPAVVDPPTEQPTVIGTIVAGEVPVATMPQPTAEEEPASTPSFINDFDLWTIDGLKALAADLVSDRTLRVRMFDLTTIAVESAVAGAAVVALLIVMLRPNA